MNILRENVRLTRAMYEFNTYYERQMKLMLADLKVRNCFVHRSI